MNENIRSACYSNIHVYEMIVRGVPLMIRKADGYVNATQILRAAGLPKPARTKVLEREVTRGVHEKIQGGYAGSQGTWIPLESARILATQYGVFDGCSPLFDYDMGCGHAELISPPLKVRRISSVKPKFDETMMNDEDIFRTGAFLDHREKRKTRTIKDFSGYENSDNFSDIKNGFEVHEGQEEDDEDAYSSLDDKISRPARKILKFSRALQPAQSTSPTSTGNKKAKRTCNICGSENTPQWRRGPNGKRSLCNACGVKWSSGRLTVNNAPGSPFPFHMTESEHADTSDNASVVEDIEVGSSAWHLQLEVSRLKSKLRETNHNNKKLLKLYSEAQYADHQIDQAYRQMISAAKKSRATIYNPANSFLQEDKFYSSDQEFIGSGAEIRYGDATDSDVRIAKSFENNFITVVNQLSR